MDSQSAIHDASTGFHDIKPLPDFSPFLSLLPALVILLMLVAGLVWWILRSRKPRTASKQSPPAPPDAAALKALRRLEAKRKDLSVDVRTYFWELSMILRQYLEAALCFSATECTVREILLHLPKAFKKRLPLNPRSLNDSLCLSVKRILKHCERAEFCEEAELRYSLAGESAVSTAGQTEETIKELSRLLRREEDRIRSVAEHKAGKDKA